MSRSGEQLQVLADAAGYEHRPVRQPRDLPPPVLRIQVGDFDTVDEDAPRMQPEDRLEHGALACAVGARQHGDPAGFDVSIERVEVDDGAVRVDGPGARGSLHQRVE